MACLLRPTCCVLCAAFNRRLLCLCSCLPRTPCSHRRARMEKVLVLQMSRNRRGQPAQHVCSAQMIPATFPAHRAAHAVQAVRLECWPPGGMPAGNGRLARWQQRSSARHAAPHSSVSIQFGRIKHVRRELRPCLLSKFVLQQKASQKSRLDLAPDPRCSRHLSILDIVSRLGTYFLKRTGIPCRCNRRGHQTGKSSNPVQAASASTVAAYGVTAALVRTLIPLQRRLFCAAFPAGLRR